MKIIVDGCDGTGKTTLINEIIKLNPKLKVIKFSQPKTNDPYSEWIGYYTPGHENYVGDNVILDRCWISEVVYGEILNRENKLTLEQQSEFAYLTKDDLYIIASTNLDNIEKVFLERGEDFIDLPQASRVNYYFKKFKEKLQENGITVISYDWSKQGKRLQSFINNNILGK